MSIATSMVTRPATWLGPEPAQGVFVSAVAGLAVVSVVVLTLRGFQQPWIALAFGALVVVGEVTRIRLPNNREFAPIAVAGGLAYALLLAVGDVPATHRAFQVVVVMAAAVVLGALPHLAAGRAVRFHDMARRVLLASLAALMFRPVIPLLSPASTPGLVTVGVLVGVVLLAGGLEMAGSTAVRSGLSLDRFRVALRDEIHTRKTLGSAIAATALLIATAAHVMGAAALIVCSAPLVVTQVAYRRYCGIRATYLQTIRALSQAPEVGGYVGSGHSRRVSQLAVRVGRELGLSEPELLQLEYAALMHDIGQLSLRDPKPSGATVHAPAAEQRRIAELGAEVVRETGVLDRVAHVIERQAQPYSRPGGRPDPDDPPPASRIIRVANAYDDLTGGVSDAAGYRAAMDHLRLAGGQDYDPRVVRALARLV